MSTTKFTYQQAQKPRSYGSLKLRPSERLSGVDTGASVAAKTAFFMIIFYILYPPKENLHINKLKSLEATLV